ncbi:AAA family ATPase [Candidatus Halobeggiatoa sp. HSG11]|nr:AAA family ATPase [Candidatus Halobeggiatoa sp. HSG11]
MNDLVLSLKNIGLIKEANIKIDGLTVIAGENDTGKSTVGKSLFFINQFWDINKLKSNIYYRFNNIFYFLPQKNVKIAFNQNIFKYETSLDKDKLVNGLKDIINGEFIYVALKELIFKRANQEFNINAVATGIKNFGILQLLIKNNYLTKDSILIVDEPEVHLHPKWQLEYAKFIVELVKNGVNVLITSHSPYMVEALKRYSEKEQINSDFYLAENGFVDKIENSNSKTLAKIFEKLSEPFDIFEQIEMEKLLNG